MLCSLGFSPAYFLSVPAKEGKVSLGRLEDSYPGDSIHHRGYFLRCFFLVLISHLLELWAVAPVGL